MKKKFLVTGGAGFIGSHLVDELVTQGHKVAVVDNLSTGKKSNLNPKAVFYKKDIRRYKDIKPLLANIDGVFHLAANPSVQFSIDNPIFAHDINVNGTLNVLAAAKNTGVKRVIFASSCGVYGNALASPQHEKLEAAPVTPYGFHKLVGEKYCRLFSDLYGLNTIALRYFNVYGPRMADSGPYSGVIKIFLKQKKAGQPLTITGDGRQSRDLVYVADVVRANILAMASPKIGKGEVINIGTGKAYSVNEIAEMIGGQKKYLPPRMELKHSLAKNSLAQKLLGWRPQVALKQGLSQLI